MNKQSGKKSVNPVFSHLHKNAEKVFRQGFAESTCGNGEFCHTIRGNLRQRKTATAAEWLYSIQENIAYGARWARPGQVEGN
jgi:hypothetical protein